MSKNHEIDRLLRRKNQSLTCLPHDSEVETRDFPIRHRLASPPVVVPLQDPTLQPFLDFYAQHDGGLFYEEPLSGSAALEMHPTRVWESFHGALRDSLFSDSPEWFDTCIAFASASHSADGYVAVRHGPLAGQVHFFDHETSNFRQVALDCRDFFRQLVYDPSFFLEKFCFIYGQRTWYVDSYLYNEP